MASSHVKPPDRADTHATPMARGRCGTKTIIIMSELFAVALPTIKSAIRKAYMTKAHADKHDFIKIECPINHSVRSSFLKELPIADPTSAYKKRKSADTQKSHADRWTTTPEDSMGHKGQRQGVNHHDA
jgi:hypothetical protein